MRFSCSGNLATMAPGLPYANAAQVGVPRPPGRRVRRRRRLHDARCEFITAVKYKLPIKVIVIKNNVLGQIKWEQMIFLGNPEYGVELQPIDFVKFAEACGGVGFRCETPDEVGPAMAAAFAIERAGAGRGGRRPVRAADARAGDGQAGRSSWPSRSSAASRTRARSPRRSSATRSTNCSEPAVKRISARTAADAASIAACLHHRLGPGFNRSRLRSQLTQSRVQLEGSFSFCRTPKSWSPVA